MRARPAARPAIRPASRLLFAVALALASLFARSAMAAPPELRTAVSADTVALGEIVQLQLQAMVTGGAQPANPRAGATSGFQLRGTSVSPSSQTLIMNGVRTDKQGLVATWSLHAERPGTFTIGPPSVEVAGKRFTGQAVRIVVLPAGQAPPSRGGLGPLSPWLGRFGLDDDAPREVDPTASADPKLALDAPRGQTAFLHATVDKTRAVVGEQVTLSVMLYCEANQNEPDFTDVHEATASDYLKRSLLDNDSQARFLGLGVVGGRLYRVKLIRKSALFPLKTGALDIGPMNLAFARARGDTRRESERLVVDVTEPPLAGRPAGYIVGDVGHFSLTSEVAPREVERGGAVGVTIQLEGSGNLPAALAVPTRAGVEWLTPETSEKVGGLRGGDKFGGQRRFAYVVRMQTAGDVDLGEVQVPYWDPDARAYGVARATIGVVHVSGAPGAAPAEAPIDPLPGLPAARAGLAGAAPTARRLGDAWFFWLGLAVGPLAYPVFAGARAAARRLRAGRDAKAGDPRTDMHARVAEAEAAARRSDAKALDRAAARALEASAIACADVSLRGLGADAAILELARAGLPADDAREVVLLHQECQTARFSPEEVPAEDAKARWKKARGLIKALGKAHGAEAA